MPKLEPSGRTQKISLSQILDTGNVREDYRDIEELAQSIKDNGLMQPVVVKRAGINTVGISQYELIAGHRRKKALEYLCSKGDDFSMVDAVIITGDKLTLQLIENIQRSDLTSAERENGVAEMLNTGLSQREIAAKLAKTEQWVSKHLAAHKTRQVLTSKGINCDKYETNILTAFRTVPDGDLIPLIKKLEESGGTKTAAEKITREYKEGRMPKENYTNETAKEEIQANALKDDFKTDTDFSASLAEKESEIKTPEHTAFNNYIKKEETKPAKTDSIKNNETVYGEKIEPEDKLLSSKFVFTQIHDYIQAVQNKIKILGNETAKNTQQAKIEAAYDIIALLHTRD